MFQGEGKAAFGITRYRIKQRYRGSSRTRMTLKPRLALWGCLGFLIEG